MALPASGTISFSDINVEMGFSSSATCSLQTRTQGTLPPINQATPYSISEFYSHTQDGIEVLPVGVVRSNAAGNFDVTITTGVAWTLDDGGATWVTPASTSGSGNDVVNIAYDANGGSERVATITVTTSGGSDTCVLTQQAA
jgi:hypothetical protein